MNTLLLVLIPPLLSGYHDIRAPWLRAPSRERAFTRFGLPKRVLLCTIYARLPLLDPPPAPHTHSGFPNSPRRASRNVLVPRGGRRRDLRRTGNRARDRTGRTDGDRVRATCVRAISTGQYGGVGWL